MAEVGVIHTFTLPFGETAELCDICGSGSAQTARCRTAGKPERPKYAVGDIVHIYDIEWRDGHRVRSEDPIRVEITGFSYVQPFEADYMREYRAMDLAVHELKIRYIKLGEYVIGSFSWCTAAVFEILREGDIEKLRAANLMNVPPLPTYVPPAPKRWWQFWK